MSNQQEGAKGRAYEGSGAARKASPKRKKPIIVGSVMAVIAVLAVGMWVWHEQPGFCNTMCHTSMDAYVQTYEQQAGREGIDKFGNPVSNASAMLVVSHKEAGQNCLACHVPTLSQQIGEVGETVTGDYYVVERNDGLGYALEEVGVEALMINSGHEEGSGEEFCLRSGCHDVTSREELKASTADLEFNPHAFHHGDYTCSNCHKSHRASVMVCTQCHGTAVDIMPDGWVTAAQSNEQLPEAAIA